MSHEITLKKLVKLFKGWAIISEAFKVSPGTVQSCSKVLKEGNYLAISPGGVYEAQFGDNYYELMWGRRIGFAKVAIDAKAVRFLRLLEFL